MVHYCQGVPYLAVKVESTSTYFSKVRAIEVMINSYPSIYFLWYILAMYLIKYLTGIFKKPKF